MAHMAFFSVGSAGSSRHSRSMSSHEQRLMRELFQLADANKDGVVDYEEYARMFSGKGLRISKEEVRAVFDMMDKNRDMKLSPCEVFDVESIIKEKAKAAVRAYDTNKDGKVSRREMANVSGGRLSAQAINKVFEKHDADGDGLLDRKEMENMMRMANSNNAVKARSK